MGEKVFGPFKRLNKFDFDIDSTFDSYDAALRYAQDPLSTAYFGQRIFVKSEMTITDKTGDGVAITETGKFGDVYTIKKKYKYDEVTGEIVTDENGEYVFEWYLDKLVTVDNFIWALDESKDVLTDLVSKKIIITQDMLFAGLSDKINKAYLAIHEHINKEFLDKITVDDITTLQRFTTQSFENADVARLKSITDTHLTNASAYDTRSQAMMKVLLGKKADSSINRAEFTADDIEHLRLYTGEKREDYLSKLNLLVEKDLNENDICSLQLISRQYSQGKTLATEDYVTTAVTAEAEAARAAEKALQDAIDTINIPVIGTADDEKVISITDKKLVSTLSIKKTKKKDGKTYVQLIGKEGAVVSEFDADGFIADGMLESVTKDTETNEIVFKWNTTAGVNETRIDIDDLVEVYATGNGIDITDFVVSVKRDATSENFLTIGVDGIKLSGVQAAIDAAKQEMFDYVDEADKDWAQEDETQPDYIKNKPSIRTGQGSNSIVEGNLTEALGENSHAEGVGNIAGCRGFNIIAIDPIGYDSTETAPTEMHLTLDSVEGLAVEDSCSVAINKNYMEMGKITNISENTITINAYPDDLTAAIISKTVVGGGDKLAYVFVSTKQNIGTTIFGSAQHAEGYETAALMIAAHAEGAATVASGKYSHAEGDSTFAGYAAHAEGQRTKALGGVSHAEGSNTTASGVSSHAEGQLSTASGSHSHAEGYDTDALGNRAHSEGYKTTAQGTDSHSEGNATKAIGNQSHTEGQGSEASGWTAHAEGYKTQATKNKAHAEGGNTIASGETAHAEGHFTIASGYASHAEGFSSNAANGIATVASARGSHAEGIDTLASAEGSHAEGNSTAASGKYAHSEGISTIANGRSSHAEGEKAKAYAPYSHAEGRECVAGTFGQINDPNNTDDPSKAVASEGAHAEGRYSKATGQAAHAEGNNTVASGAHSHTEGTDSRATASRAHAEGHATIASGDSQHAQGKYNVQDSSKAHIIGGGRKYKDDNGEWVEERKNIHTVDWDGNAWFAGDVTVGNNAEKLATVAQLEELEKKIAPAYKFYTDDLVKYQKQIPTGALTYATIDRLGGCTYGTPIIENKMLVLTSKNIDTEDFDISIEGDVSGDNVISVRSKERTAEWNDICYEVDLVNLGNDEFYLVRYRYIDRIYSYEQDSGGAYIYDSISQQYYPYSIQQFIKTATGWEQAAIGTHIYQNGEYVEVAFNLTFETGSYGSSNIAGIIDRKPYYKNSDGTVNQLQVSMHLCKHSDSSKIMCYDDGALGKAISSGLHIIELHDSNGTSHYINVCFFASKISNSNVVFDIVNEDELWNSNRLGLTEVHYYTGLSYYVDGSAGTYVYKDSLSIHVESNRFKPSDGLYGFTYSTTGTLNGYTLTDEFINPFNQTTDLGDGEWNLDVDQASHIDEITSISLKARNSYVGLGDYPHKYVLNSLTFHIRAHYDYLARYRYDPVKVTAIAIGRLGASGELISSNKIFIPAEVQQIEGYGVGCDPDLYNYINFESLQFVRKCKQNNEYEVVPINPPETVDVSAYFDNGDFKINPDDTVIRFENEYDSAVASTITYQIKI